MAVVVGAGGVPGLDMQGAQFSAINALRTGNMVMDMIVAMLLIHTTTSILLMKLETEVYQASKTFFTARSSA